MPQRLDLRAVLGEIVEDAERARDAYEGSDSERALRYTRQVMRGAGRALQRLEVITELQADAYHAAEVDRALKPK